MKKSLNRESLLAWVARLAAEETLYAPVARDDKFVFDRLRDPADLRLDYDVTILPPKKYFQPPVELILRCKNRAEYESVMDPTPFVLFGVHPYDLAALNQMTEFFEAGTPDPHVRARREAATIVALDPERATGSVFAAAMGTAALGDGWDARLTRIGDDRYLAEARTEKGRGLLERLEGQDPAPADLEARGRVESTNAERLGAQKVQWKPEELPELLAKNVDHPVWTEMSDRCFSCGSCNIVCPTCYCFDVSEDMDWSLTEARRCRAWDGCLLPEFALVAGGHNFRPSRAQRYRHRFYRKGKYLWDRLRQISCVGCGRCVTACVPDIANPVEVFNRLAGARP